MTEPTITYEELRRAFMEDDCSPNTEPTLYALLEKNQPEPLFGRRAEHPFHGYGVIISNALTEDRRVLFAHKIKAPGNNIGVSYVDYVDYEDLKTEPITLETYQELRDAPDGTIVEAMVEPKDVYVKADNVWYGAGEDYGISSRSLTKVRVIRWGNDD